MHPNTEGDKKTCYQPLFRCVCTLKRNVCTII